MIRFLDLFADADAKCLSEVTTSAEETPYNVEATPSNLDGGRGDGASDGLGAVSEIGFRPRLLPDLACLSGLAGGGRRDAV